MKMSVLYEENLKAADMNRMNRGGRLPHVMPGCHTDSVSDLRDYHDSQICIGRKQLIRFIPGCCQMIWF